MRINVMARIGYVYVYSNYAGTIEENDDGYRFCYDEEYLKGELSTTSEAKAKRISRITIP